MQFALGVLFDPIPLDVVPDDDSAGEDRDSVAVLIEASDIAKLVDLYSKPPFVVFLQHTSFGVRFEGESIFWIVDLPLLLVVFPHEVPLFVFKQCSALVLHYLKTVGREAVDGTVLIDFYPITLFVHMLLIGGIPHYSETVRVVEGSFPILLLHFIPSFIVRFAIDELVPILVEYPMLTIDYTNFLPQLVISLVVAFLVDFHEVTVLVVADGVVVRVVFELVTMAVELNWLPLPLEVGALVPLGLLQLKLRFILLPSPPNLGLR